MLYICKFGHMFLGRQFHVSLATIIELNFEMVWLRKKLLALNELNSAEV